ncbi:GNAT family N-acetyltransferase [Anaeromicropila herbilytica]|uniref:N-acetyltransferase n=1 Tax=Anaeromicropila herbilytica TaxID=2785025 RepID=A0A7R7EPG4_9FIRM|nr:GNAT family N-acetyltransferase [Anaeromicropila herbilytica]BCN32636.1 N-acetyltransferase [Anaeromicropila herbilytica]
MSEISIEIEDIESAEASKLIDELSEQLERITGNNGKGSFDSSDMKNQRAAFVIARIDGDAVGCGGFRELSDETAEIKRMYARTRSIGTGKKILKFIEELAKDYGYHRTVLETRSCNQNAVDFYLSQGYVVINNYGKYVNREEAICFQKKL